MSLEPLFSALQAALPHSVRVGDSLRLPAPGGALRIVVPRSPWDVQVDHGLAVGFAPRLGEESTLDACHLRTRCRRSVDAIEAAQALSRGENIEQSARLIALEMAAQIAEMWGPFLKPEAWVGPSVESLLGQSSNAAPADAEPLLAMLRAAACTELGQRDDARHWASVASKAVDPRVRQALKTVQRRLADA